MKGRGEHHIFIERGPDEYLAGPKWATTEQDWPGQENVETVGHKISNFSARRFNINICMHVLYLFFKKCGHL